VRLTLVLVLMGCAFTPDPVEDETPAPPAGDEPSSPGGAGDDGSEPSDPGQSGEPSCRPLSCADMGAECGMQDDGCGAQVACGGCPVACEDARCVCAIDRMEPNPSADAANDLGEYSDEWGGEVTVADLGVRDEGDEDWFKVRVVDDIGLQNPWVKVELEQDTEVHQLDVYFTCDHGDDANVCLSGEEQSAGGFGSACRGDGSDPEAVVSAQCLGTLDESGTVWVRVRRVTFDGACPSYSLKVSVNPL
jgi:hypothetical protein